MLEEQNENQWAGIGRNTLTNIGPEGLSDQGQENREQTEGREITKTVPEKPLVVEAPGNDNVGSEVMDEAGVKLEIQPKEYPRRVRRPPERYGDGKNVVFLREGRRCNNLRMMHAHA